LRALGVGVRMKQTALVERCLDGVCEVPPADPDLDGINGAERGEEDEGAVKRKGGT